MCYEQYYRGVTSDEAIAISLLIKTCSIPVEVFVILWSTVSVAPQTPYSKVFVAQLAIVLSTLITEWAQILPALKAFVPHHSTAY